jgi:NAD(P)-dependent dehydrogenase (short-subunit alcohol dehydrogenase family)
MAAISLPPYRPGPKDDIMHLMGPKLLDRTAIITGAGSGIGRASALLFAQHGANVVVADIVESAGQETVQEIAAAGGTAMFLRTDVTRATDLQALVQAAMTSYGRLDVLFNNAGVTIPATVEETTDEVWDRSIAVNLKSVMLGCKVALPHMIAGGGGSVINTASMLGLVASPRQAPYAAAKGGVVLLTKQIAIDYARHNIRVNCICPSEVDTPMHRRFIDESPDPEATRQRLLARIPLGRVAAAQELASVALFLASDDSSYITGVALPVDGGLTAL